MERDYPVTACRHGAFASKNKVGEQLPTNRREHLLDRLRTRQQQQGFVPLDQVAATAEPLDVPSSQAFGVASFYSMIDLNRNETSDRSVRVIRVCDGPTCYLRGGCDVLANLRADTSDRSDVNVVRTSCLGLCDVAPAALVDDQPVQLPAQVKASDALELPTVSTPVVAHQPDSILPLTGGWEAGSTSSFDLDDVLRKTLSITPAELLDTIEQSGLRGRGGAGFNTGTKWKMVAATSASERYVVCNADESEPGNFKDRQLMEHFPNRLLAGMI
ncbi:MAG: NAD(P)H-dependent oxidoreductase subunit E, partial [Planctomycetales bacterium]|nr:NAD(P)H-dependent oxidoreductase subunit E [Planctomycetales bacterium]